MEWYRHRQTGAGLRWLFWGVGLFDVAIVFGIERYMRAHTGGELGVPPEAFLVTLLSTATFFIFGLLYATFDVVVRDDALEAAPFFGLWKHRVPLADVEELERCDLRWFEVGIKRRRNGWLFAVAPGDALGFRMRDGRMLMLGTDDFDRLWSVLDERLRAAREKR